MSGPLYIVSGQGMGHVVVLDASGREVRHADVRGHTRAELDLSGLAPGPYVVRIWTGTGLVTRPLVNH